MLQPILDKIINDIYAGQNTLNEDYIHTISDLLNDAIYKSYNFDGNFNNPDFDSKDLDIIKALTENVYQFSGAKNAALNKTLQELLIEDGEILSFTNFNKKAKQVGLLFNKTYLKTEYNTAILQSQNIVDWNSFDDHDMLQFSAVIDSHTAPLDRSLNGIALPKSDSLWRFATPQLHYNCRCRLIAVNDSLPSSLSKSKRSKIRSKIPKEFRNNPALTNEIFPKNHPYWRVVDGG